MVVQKKNGGFPKQNCNFTSHLRQRGSVCAKSLGVSEKELHLIRFPLGNERAKAYDRIQVSFKTTNSNEK
jgi:hypothetical protein